MTHHHTCLLLALLAIGTASTAQNRDTALNTPRVWDRPDSVIIADTLLFPNDRFYSRLPYNLSPERTEWADSGAAVYNYNDSNNQVSLTLRTDQWFVLRTSQNGSNIFSTGQWRQMQDSIFCIHWDAPLVIAMARDPKINFLDRKVSANWPARPLRVDHWWFVKRGQQFIPWSFPKVDAPATAPDYEYPAYAWEQDPGDTLEVRLKARKRVYYFNGAVTMVISYRDFKREFFPYYKRMKKEMNRGGAVNADWEKFIPALDSFYASAIRQAATSNTIHLFKRDLAKAGLGGLRLDWVIEKRRCLIIDLDDHVHHSIIRKRFEHQEGFLEGEGGRNYYLPGKKIPFCTGIDWIS